MTKLTPKQKAENELTKLKAIIENKNRLFQDKMKPYHDHESALIRMIEAADVHK